MPDPDTITALKRTGSNVQERMSSYLSFAKATLEKYDRASDGGRVPPLAAFLRYDIEVLANALSDPFDFDTLQDYPLSSGQLQGLERMRALCDDVREFYAEGGNHQTEVAEAYKGDHGMTQSEVQRIERSAGVIRRALDPYYSCLDKVLDTNRNYGKPDPTPPKRQPNDRGGYGYGAQPEPTTIGGELSYHRVRRSGQGGGGGGHYLKRRSGGGRDASFGDLVDVVARLQNQNQITGGVSGLGGSAAAFQVQVRQKMIQQGFPDPKSETFLARRDDSAADKVFDTLNRSIATAVVGGVATYAYNPLKARGAIIGAEGTAIGAQAVTAETIRNLKDPFMTNVHALVSESVVGEQDEADDLKIAIADGIDRLIDEASSERGVFVLWIEQLIDTVFRDVISLADLYDIRNPANVPELEPIDTDLSYLDGLSVSGILDAVSIEPAGIRTLRDPDVGIMQAEANDRALLSIVSQLLLMRSLIMPGSTLGPILGRVRALNDAISASVLAAQNALAAAGLSEGDQIITFAGPSVGNIDLRRLLEWIKEESILARPFYYRADLNRSDLRRLSSARDTQRLALEAFMEADFPTLTENSFSLGRRELEEVQLHLDTIVGLIDQLSVRPAGGDDTPAGVSSRTNAG